MSTIEVNKVTPVSGGTTVQVGESGDTINIPAGATLANAGSVTGLPASAISSGTIAAARLGSGTASSSTFLRGDQTYAAVDDPGWKLLRTGGVSAGDAYATLTGLFTSTYKIYKIFFYDWNTSVDAAPYLQWVTGTNTVESGAGTYQYAGVGFNTSGQNSAWSGSDTQFQIAGETIRHASDEQFAWEGTLYNPAGTTLKKRLVFSGGGRRTSNYGFSANGTGEWNSTTAITGFKVRPSGGTFDSLIAQPTFLFACAQSD